MLSTLLNRRRRPMEGDDETVEPTHADKRLPLHIIAHDARMSISEGLVTVEADGADQSLRLDEISLVALHGGACVTAPALRCLAEASVPVILHSASGYYVAQITDLSGLQADTRRAQYAAASDRSQTLDLARVLVEAKIHGTARLLRRRVGAFDSATRRLDREAHSAAKARSVESLRGHEGAAAAAWFETWPRLIKREDDLLVFRGRNRRPAQDAINALLNYLYAVLVGQTAAAALAAGLDPNVGFLHAERPGRPALALDLVEPLRVAIVDAAVIAALNNGEFAPEDFAPQPDGSIRLSDTGRRRALSVLERRLSTALVYDGTEMSWRSAISHHALLLARRLRKKSGDWPAPSPK